MNDLHIKTPLIESLPLARTAGTRVWLKMEALQPSGSFKLRGIGHACRRYRSKGAKRFISSSGGNAGIAVAYSGRQLDIPVTVVVPESTTRQAIEAIGQEGAELIIKGESWQESHDYCLRMADQANVLIHPFDDPLLWEGHATMIDEIAETGLVPDAVVLSVGGGGLLSGVVEGLQRNGLKDVPVLAVETKGAHSLALAIQQNRLVELDEISSIATTLGAKQVSQQAYNCCRKHDVTSHLASDLEAVTACLTFLKEHRLLVEPACGASLSALITANEFFRNRQNVLVIVCGGAGVSIKQLQSWKDSLAARMRLPGKNPN